MKKKRSCCHSRDYKKGRGGAHLENYGAKTPSSRGIQEREEGFTRTSPLMQGDTIHGWGRREHLYLATGDSKKEKKNG